MFSVENKKCYYFFQIFFSHQNPVLRSASFHGTGDITPNYVSSEEEVTLSADEEDSPLSACPVISNTDSPSKVNISLIIYEDITFAFSLFSVSV